MNAQQQQVQEQEPQGQEPQDQRIARFVQGKLEIQEMFVMESDLYPEIKEEINDTIYQWVREHYSEMVDILQAEDKNEYTDSRILNHLFYHNIIDENNSLEEVFLSSGIIEKHRNSIYLYCCEKLQINPAPTDQTDGWILNANNDAHIARALSISFPSEILLNSFIEIRDSPVLK